MRLLWRSIVTAAVVLAFGGPTVEADSALPAVMRPKRLVHRFDFEERVYGNFEDKPMHWYVTGRAAQTTDPHFHRQLLHQQLIGKPDFPSYTEVRFDDRYKTSGDFSFYLGLNGGNAGAFLQAGTLPAVPSSDYRVVANVRTENTLRAAARLVAYFVDDQGQRIEASRASTEPLRTDGRWSTVSVKLTGDFATAAWIGLELELLQPQPAPDHPLGKQQIVLPDLSASAWFDDIGVWQLPHVQIASQSRVNIIRAPQQPRLTMDVRDLTNQPLLAELTVYDHAYRPVAQVRKQVGAGAPSRWDWTPKLPAFGWYLIDMIVREQPDRAMRNDDATVGTSGSMPSPAPGLAPGSASEPRRETTLASDDSPGPIARTICAVLWLAKEQGLAPLDRKRFALVAEDLPEAQLELLPELLEASMLDAVVLSAWSRKTTLQTLDRRQEQLDQLLNRILIADRAVTMSLYPVPTELSRSEGVDTTQPLGVLQHKEQTWLPYLAPVLQRHGQRVRRWQLGRSNEADAFFHPSLGSLLTTIERQFRALAPQPKLVVPWGLHQARRPELGTNLILAMDVPTAVRAQFLADYLAEWRQPAMEYWLYLHEPPADRVAHHRREVDLTLRMIHGWENGAAVLALSRPWTRSLQRHLAVWPDPLLGVFSGVAQRLAGRRVLGRMPLGQGLQCLILSGATDGGCLVTWNRSAARAVAALDMYLGDEPVAIDPWGNRHPVEKIDGRHRLRIGESPLFVTGIDSQLALFRAGFRLDQPFVESSLTPHRRMIQLKNPWPRSVSGHFQITGPKRWTVQPVRHVFSLGPGQSVSIPVQISFPLAEVAGKKKLTARFDFTADRRYQIQMAAPLELGLRDIDFQATLALIPGPTPGVPPGSDTTSATGTTAASLDALVVAVVANTGERPRAVRVFAILKGQPPQERFSRLEPGQSRVRRFLFSGVADAIRSTPIRTGVRDANGPAILNKLLSFDDAP